MPGVCSNKDKAVGLQIRQNWNLSVCLWTTGCQMIVSDLVPFSSLLLCCGKVEQFVPTHRDRCTHTYTHTHLLVCDMCCMIYAVWYMQPHSASCTPKTHTQLHSPTHTHTFIYTHSLYESAHLHCSTGQWGNSQITPTFTTNRPSGVKTNRGSDLHPEVVLKGKGTIKSVPSCKLFPLPYFLSAKLIWFQS